MLEFINLKDRQWTLNSFTSFGFPCLLISLYAKKGQAMKESDVKIGKVYFVKVSGKTARLRILYVSGKHGWTGYNLRTNRTCHIKKIRDILGLCPNYS